MIKSAKKHCQDQKHRRRHLFDIISHKNQSRTMINSARHITEEYREELLLLYPNHQDSNVQMDFLPSLDEPEVFSLEDQPIHHAKRFSAFTFGETDDQFNNKSFSSRPNYLAHHDNIMTSAAERNLPTSRLLLSSLKSCEMA